MKRTKFLLTAMALPMLFTACSQDELVDDYGVQKGPEAEGFYATLNPSFDEGTDSRAAWAGTKLTWDTTDKISLYWLGTNPVLGPAPVTGSDAAPAAEAAATHAKYQFNSVFKTTDGYEFDSESMVFVGGNVAVYPANTGNFEAGNDIVLEVPAVQDANTIKTIPYISNYLDVQSRTNQTDNNPGYNNGIDAPMKMAANVLNLTFELKNTAGLSAYGFAVESVELEANGAFATKAVINTDQREEYDASGSELTTTTVDNPFYGSEQEYKDGNQVKKANTITKNLWITPVAASKVGKLTTTAITQNANGTYTAQFVVLPTDVAITTGAKIVINTTCGHVDITTPAEDNLATGVDERLVITNGVTSTTLETCLTNVVASGRITYSENSTSKFMGEKTGRVFPRSIVADMNNATLNNSKVYTSADIIRYVDIYNKMGKENTTDDKLMNLVLSSTNSGANNTFAGLTKAALAAVDGENNYSLGYGGYKNVTLSAGNIAAVEISNAGEVYDIKSLTGTKKVDLVLAAGAAWTMNDALALNANINKICNKGTLTIKGTVNDKNEQKSLVTTVCNEGTLKIGGNGILQVPGNLTTAWGSTTEIAANQNLKFTKALAGDNHLYGTFDVKDATSFLTAASGVDIVNEAVINNWGTVAAEGGVESNGFINQAVSAKINDTEYEGGIINVKGAQAFTYVHNNAKGTINMLTRTDEVMVASALKGSIVYPYTAADGSTFTYTVEDRFNTVEFGNDVPNLTLIEEGTDLDGDEEEDMLSIKGLSFIFNGTTTLKADKSKKFEIDKLTVNSGANLRITTGNELTVNDLENNGIITVGGYIYYKNSCAKGTVYSQGGAIKAYDATTTVSYAQELVNNALAEAAASSTGEAEITLDRDLTLSAPMNFEAAESRDAEEKTKKIVLNLNGHSITNNTPVKGACGQPKDITAAAAIYVNDANLELTIMGDSETEVSVDAGAQYQSAVWVRQGKVTINGGKYYVGKDDQENGCTTIQGYANDTYQSYITIKDGSFSCDPASVGFAYEQYACLNLTGGTVNNARTYMSVEGGRFYCFNPANNCSEGANTNFVAEGKTVTVEKTGKESAGPFDMSYEKGWYVVK